MLELKNLKNYNNSKSTRNKTVYGENVLLDTSNKVVNDILNILVKNNVIDNKVTSNEKITKLLNQDTLTTLTQFQNLTYTRGLFAAQGTKI